MSAYDAAFYDDQTEGSLRSARIVLPVVFALHRPASLVDVGCGQGTWLAAAEELGVEDLTGLDGDWVDRAKLRSPRMTFRAVDLAAPIAFDRRYDLALSVEVAEHLPASAADGFVAALCAASDAVLFSAAAPFQGGTDHVHEARASAWAARFAANGFDCFDLVRGAIWDRAEVAWWYRQNLLLFAKRGSAAHAAFARAPLPPPPRDVVHPDAFEEKVAHAEREVARLRGWVERPTLRQGIGALLRAIGGALGVVRGPSAR
jgi:SAM-dependent methyltransferase